MAAMMSAISTATSGMLASVARLNAAASNIANAGTSGPLPETAAAPATEAAPRVYQPVDVVLKSVGGESGSTGVMARYRPRVPAYVREYDPSAPYASADGFVAAPNVDLAAEAVAVLEASLMFQANLAVLKRADEMAKSLIDTLA